MISPKANFILSLCGFAILLYIWIFLPFNFYEPTRQFHLPLILWLIHIFTLYIHEAGHFFFSFFGRTIYFLGGSIMQVLVPFVWFIVALRQHSRLSSVALFFTGESLVDASIYVRDAKLRVLPLLGGHGTKHDWATVLGEAGKLDWAEPLGELFFYFGLTISLCAIGRGVWVSARVYQQERLDAFRSNQLSPL
ncbi:MAG: hypothetical protein KGJ59_11670, partial [Bacteroidota bacterium]|nr:hypothetical protein [Bacteroidota bacterium]